MGLFSGGEGGLYTGSLFSRFYGMWINLFIYLFLIAPIMILSLLLLLLLFALSFYYF